MLGGAQQARARRAGSSTMSVFSVCTVPGLEEEEERRRGVLEVGWKEAGMPPTDKMSGMRAD